MLDRLGQHSGVVTKPFAFEGRRRMVQAEQGLAELSEAVDTVICIPNEKLLAVPKENARDAFIAQRCAYYMDSSGSAVAFYSLIKDFQWMAAMPIHRQAERQPRASINAWKR